MCQGALASAVSLIEPTLHLLGLGEPFYAILIDSERTIIMKKGAFSKKLELVVALQQCLCYCA